MTQDNSADIHRSLGRLEGKLDTLLDTLKEHSKDVQKVEDRLAKIESETAGGKQVAGILGAVGGGLVTAAAAAADPIMRLFK